MKYEAIKLSATEDYDPSKGGFESEEAAWEYIESHRCKICVAEADTEDPSFTCDAEWGVYPENRRKKSLHN